VVRVINCLIEKEKFRFETACDAKWRISADLAAANCLREKAFLQLRPYLALQQVRNPGFEFNFNGLRFRTVKVWA
jgi:hypothetical protein